MLVKLMKNKKMNKMQRGDTIVEVLIAIAVAAFSIGTAYAIANKSLQQAITANERNEAVNLIQGQIAALKIRQSANQAAFFDNDPNIGFVVPTTIIKSDSELPYTDSHFCLDEKSASKADTTHPWQRQVNTFTPPNTADNISATNTYNTKCIYDNSAKTNQYFVDIEAQITLGSKVATLNRTVYKVTVRWAQLGSATNAKSTVYYRF